MSAPYDIVQSVQTNGGAFNSTAAQTATATWPSTTLAGNLLAAVAITDGWDALGNPSPTDWATSAPAGWTWGGIARKQGQTVAVFYILSSAPRSGAEVFNLGWEVIGGSDFSLTLIEVDAAGATFDNVVWEDFEDTAGFGGGQALGLNGVTAGVFIGAATTTGSSHDPPFQIGAQPPSGTNQLGAFHLDDVAYIHQGAGPSIRAVVGTCMDANSMQVTGDVTLFGDGGGTNGAIGFLWISPSAGDPVGSGGGSGSGSGSGGGSGSGSGSGSGGGPAPTVEVIVSSGDIEVICTGPVTIADIVAAINADAGASALVTATLVGSGAAVAIDVPVTHLAGGVDAGDFIPSTGTLYETVTDGTGCVVQSLPDDTPLDPDTGYYVKIVARDIDGSAAASA